MIAKNNIFNIRTGAKWKGMTGAKNGFVEFETREWHTSMDSADAQLSSEASVRHRARHHYALRTAQREPDAGIHQVLPRARV